MASVPGPRPDQPLPRPGAPAVEPEHEPDEERRASPERRPAWLPEPYRPGREKRVNPDAPVPVP